MAETFTRYARRMIQMAQRGRLTVREAIEEIRPLREEHARRIKSREQSREPRE